MLYRRPSCSMPLTLRIAPLSAYRPPTALVCELCLLHPWQAPLGDRFVLWQRKRLASQGIPVHSVIALSHAQQHGTAYRTAVHRHYGTTTTSTVPRHRHSHVAAPCRGNTTASCSSIAGATQRRSCPSEPS